jgi:sulfur carrier protein
VHNLHLLRPPFAAVLLFAETPTIEEVFVQILVNGETINIDTMTVVQYLESLSIDPRRVAIELNLDILQKSEYGTTLLKAGDTLEIVHFVGGG